MDTWAELSYGYASWTRLGTGDFSHATPKRRARYLLTPGGPYERSAPYFQVPKGKRKPNPSPDSTAVHTPQKLHNDIKDRLTVALCALKRTWERRGGVWAPHLSITPCLSRDEGNRLRERTHALQLSRALANLTPLLIQPSNLPHSELDYWNQLVSVIEESVVRLCGNEYVLPRGSRFYMVWLLLLLGKTYHATITTQLHNNLLC